MQIQLIGDVSLVIRVTRRELRRRGLDPEGLELRDILLLTRDACIQAEVPLRRTKEIEAYPEKSGILVFVHLCGEEKEWFRFASLPDALDALALSGEPDGELAFQEQYYMSAHDQTLRLRLSEFGEAISLRESGAVEENAVLVLDKKRLRQLWGMLQSHT